MKIKNTRMGVTKKRAQQLASIALKALRIAVAKTIEEHRLSGDPIVVWENGRMVTIPASKIPPRKISGHPVVSFVSRASHRQP